MFGINKKKEKIQSLEAKVRGLIDENIELQVERNEHRLRAECYKKAFNMVNKRHNEYVKSIVDAKTSEYENPVRPLSEVDTDETDDLPFNNYMK